jgi:hypothetical protein
MIFENIMLIRKYFPDWKVYLYIAPDVDKGFVSQIGLYSNVVVHLTNKLGEVNMVERFFAIDDPDVEIMMVRDADSHVHWKDRWAIRDFLNKPTYSFHIIRDNIEHSASIMGGMWGMRKIPDLCIRDMYDLFLANPVDSGIGNDQNFLANHIYDRVKDQALVHYSNGRIKIWETGIPFPFEYTNDVYCGRCDVEPTFTDHPEPGPKKPLSKVFTALYK